MRIRLNLERPIAFYPSIARALGGEAEAVYFQQLYYWSDKGTRPDGFIYKTKTEIEAETSLSDKVQDRVRKKLEGLKVLETKLLKANGVPTLHYKVYSERMQEILDYPQPGHPITPNGDIPLTETTTKTTATTIVVGEPEVLDMVVSENDGSKIATVPEPTYGDPDINIVISTFEQTFELKLKRVVEQRRAARNLIKRYGLQNVLGGIRAAHTVSIEQYAPQIISLEDLWQKWDKLVAYYKRNKAETKSTVSIIEED